VEGKALSQPEPNTLFINQTTMKFARVSFLLIEKNHMIDKLEYETSGSITWNPEIPGGEGRRKNSLTQELIL